ncbi:unnamed protein product [Parascedosporium putredinis]|uniref:Uncharacterized protein n=1 Tax=Parascedosporium putredinis TaxID=1442378 RepID=A0A9P1MDK8_9PEZI|nr:unnamed protein product [Parascedosporium putredinis]CAI8002827.1 unnamed protein product [Parascedosporium putredinis]
MDGSKLVPGSKELSLAIGAKPWEAAGRTAKAPDLSQCVSPVSSLTRPSLRPPPPSPAADLAKRQVPGVPTKLLLGVPNSVLLVDFDGITFSVAANATEAGTNPSWLAFREPNLLYAVDEFNAVTKLFVIDRDSNTIQLVQNAAGSAGVVHLEFNLDKTRMVGSSFGTGVIDIWDITDGTLRLFKQISVLDPSGRFFVVNDLGTDTLLVIDAQDDQFEVVNRVRAATHYILLCELLNVVEVFQVTYVENSIQFVPTQIVISSDNRDVYISNRNTGNETDSITHFRSISSGGSVPRMFSLSADENLLFSTNQNSGLGLVALARNGNTAAQGGAVAAAADFSAAVEAAGTLVSSPIAALDVNIFGDANFGPQFAMQI